MRKRELIRRIKAGAVLYAPLATQNGKNWEYVRLDAEELLSDLESPVCADWFQGLLCDANEEDIKAPVWFHPVKEE